MLPEKLDTGSYVFEEEWFAGDLDIHIQKEVNKVPRCSCRQTSKLSDQCSGRDPVIMKTNTYPPYLEISDSEVILVKGSTSRLVMRLLENDIPITRIARQLTKQHRTERYSIGEVRSIIRTCSLLGLNGASPSATESWENETIEGWWLKEESFCEILRRGQPVNEQVCGYDCDSGWWNNRQGARCRDWERWPCRSIGPEERRRDQYRLYNLYGSGGLQADRTE